MDRDTFDAAVAASKEFLRRAEVLSPDIDNRIVGTKASGAVRRASLDLTRALAEMRRPG